MLGAAVLGLVAIDCSRDAPVERRPCLWPDDAAGLEAVGLLEGIHRGLGADAEPAVGGTHVDAVLPELVLQLTDGVTRLHAAAEHWVVGHRSPSFSVQPGGTIPAAGIAGSCIPGRRSACGTQGLYPNPTRDVLPAVREGFGRRPSEGPGRRPAAVRPFIAPPGTAWSPSLRDDPGVVVVRPTARPPGAFRCPPAVRVKVGQPVAASASIRPIGLMQKVLTTPTLSVTIRAMDNDSTTNRGASDEVLARFLRQLSDLAAKAALEIELGVSARPRPKARTLDDLELGSLQAAVVRVPGMEREEGIKPRAIAEYLERGDEPNIRMTLQSLAKKGITELVPGSSPQRWRLTEAFR